MLLRPIRSIKSTSITLALEHAIKSNDDGYIYDFLSNNKDDKYALNATNLRGDTCLISAVRAENYKITALLLKYDLIDVNAKNKHGETPLSIALAANHLDIINLLTNKIEINLVDSGNILLEYAIQHDQFELFKRLLQHKDITLHIAKAAIQANLFRSLLKQKKYRYLLLLIKHPACHLDDHFTLYGDDEEAPAHLHGLVQLINVIPDSEQTLLKAVICHPTNQFFLKEKFSLEQDFQRIIAECPTEVGWFVISHPNIRVISIISSEKNNLPAAFGITFHNHFVLANLANYHISMRDLIDVLLECPHFDVKQRIWDYESTVDYIRDRYDQPEWAALNEKLELSLAIRPSRPDPTYALPGVYYDSSDESNDLTPIAAYRHTP